MFINAPASAVEPNQGPPHARTLKLKLSPSDPHTRSHPTNETDRLSVGTDGFTASIDGCLEGVKKESRGYEGQPGAA